MTTRKLRSKWDVPPRHGEFDWILKDIKDEVARITPPSPPPEEPPRPPKVTVNIEIVHRAPPKRGYRFGTITLVLLILMLFGALAGCKAQAQPHHNDLRYEHWQDTNGSHGEVRRQGRTTDWTDYGPRGEVRHCHQYFVGDQAQTSCN